MKDHVCRHSTITYKLVELIKDWLNLVSRENHGTQIPSGRDGVVDPVCQLRNDAKIVAGTSHSPV